MQLGRKVQSQSDQKRSSRHRILLVDDHPIVSRALANLINHEKDLEVCGIANDCGSALRQTDALKPDLYRRA